MVAASVVEPVVLEEAEEILSRASTSAVSEMAEVVSPASSKISSAEVVPVVHKVPVSVALADSAEQVLVSVPVLNMAQADATAAAVVIAPERIRAR